MILKRVHDTAICCAIADLIGAIECAQEGRIDGYDWEAARDSIDDLMKFFKPNLSEDLLNALRRVDGDDVEGETK